MRRTRLTIVSDSHLSSRAPEAEQNWSAVLAHVERAAPDLVVHLGDLSLDGMRDPDDLRYSLAQLDRLQAPWLAVPGNHDIGDAPTTAAPPDIAVTTERRQRWIDLLGDDRWSVEVPGWRLVGVDAQLFGSGLPAEDDQWSWMESEFDRAPPAQPTVLVIHKPIAAADDELAAAPGYRFVPAAARRRIAQMVDGRGVDLVLSGHVHQYRRLELDTTTHVWAPTTWAVLPDHAQRPIGIKRCGVVSVELHGRGATETLVEPDGIRQLTLSLDLPDPYA